MKMESGNQETKRFELGTQDVFLLLFSYFLIQVPIPVPGF
jgi:hypothetical protein